MDTDRVIREARPEQLARLLALGLRRTDQGEPAAALERLRFEEAVLLDTSPNPDLIETGEGASA